MALAITRTDLSAGDLRAEARRAKDGDQAARLVAILRPPRFCPQIAGR